MGPRASRGETAWGHFTVAVNYCITIGGNMLRVELGPRLGGGDAGVIALIAHEALTPCSCPALTHMFSTIARGLPFLLRRGMCRQYSRRAAIWDREDPAL